MSLGIKCSDLLSNSDQAAARTFARELAITIDEKIISENAIGRTSILHELPTVIQIGQLSRQDTQLIVYSELVKLYHRPPSEGGKGFPTVQIRTNPRGGAYIYIAWTGSLSELERDEMYSLLAAHVVAGPRSNPRPNRTNQPAYGPR